MKLLYEEITPLNKNQAEREFASGDTTRIVYGLLGATHHETDWEWVESKCLEFLSSANPELRQVAIVCLGHLARIHGKLNKSRVLAALARSAATDSSTRVEDAIEDIEMYVKDS